MNNFKTRLLSLLAIAVSAHGLAAQSTRVDLYLEPDTDARTVATVTLDDPRLGQPTPVLDEAKAALGWHFADFTGEITGYVADAKIGKDMLPVENTIIYARPSSSSTVLGIYQDGDTIEVIDTGPWWEIQLAGSFPVYFVLDTPPPLPPVTGIAEELPPASLPEPAPMIEEVPLRDAERMTGGTGPLIDEPTTTQTRPGVLGQRYEGVFKRAKRRFGLFQPEADFYLEDARGRRIAWINTEKIVIPGSIKEFLDKPVIIHGERTQEEGSKDWTIHARNMRFK